MDHRYDNVNLRIPGPTPLPPDVREALSAQMINHRGPRFTELQQEITAGLQTLLRTKHDLLLLSCSGTGGMEAAVVNFLSPGEKVLGVSIGYFGERFRNIARAYGAEVIPLDFEWGTAAEPAAIQAALKAHPDIKAVLVTHNETSTGVTNPLKAIAQTVKGAGKLLLVDAISSAGSIELDTDGWGIDVLVTGSQKGWMVPPGLAFVAVSPEGWAAHAQAKMPRFYFDLSKAKASAEKGQTPWTPAVSIYYGLQTALKTLLAEGIDGIVARHQKIADYTRAGVKAMGLQLLADERVASNTVTAVRQPDGVEIGALLKRLRENHGVVLAGAQGPLAGKAFRIGHLGFVKAADIDQTLAALKAELPQQIAA